MMRLTRLLPGLVALRPMRTTSACFLAFLFLLSLPPGNLHAAEADDFLNPPLRYRTKPLWFWNNTTVTAAGITDQLQQARDKSGYGGFGILPFGKAFKPVYLGDPYFAVYGEAVRKSKELGMTLCLYDEYGFPSGSAGASNGDGVRRFANAFPDDTIKRLDKHEEDVTGPILYQKALPSGKLMACVAMNVETRERVDLAASALQGSEVKWNVPAGNWKIMSFVCVKDGDPNVDYLDYEACNKFVGMTHQKYYDRFKADFGPDKTINGTFFDETTLYRAKGRIWTGSFNEKFKERYKQSPALLYPALWHDIGPDTQAARNHLFGMRSELYATGFAKSSQDWCRSHGNIPATGHQDQEEVVNPCNVSGDLMKCFKYQDIPGIDKIGGNRPAELFYKVISSAANNYDKSHVMSETYGAMGNISRDEIYQVAMDQYTKGINMLIPHAVWYDPGKVTYLPELSWRNPIYNEGLQEYNRFMGRLNMLLQGEARHIADIGVLYPIATMQGGNRLDGPLGHYAGGVVIPEADYVNVGSILSDKICRDFTFVHPEVLDEKCVVAGDSFLMNNTMNPEHFKVFIVPGHVTIQWSNLRKIKAFYDAGGKVIATRMLPSKSAEFGHDDDVVRTIAEMFPETTAPKTNAKGGKSWFLPVATAANLRQALDDALQIYDVEFENDSSVQYIHKVRASRNIYFFSNLGSAPIETFAKLRGKQVPQLWDPHTGGIVAKPEFTFVRENGQDVTRVRLKLEATRSVFVISTH